MTDDVGCARTRWRIHGERLVDDERNVRLSIASVELPNGVRFEQYVLRMRRCAMTVVVDDAGENVLLIWRHRFIFDRWNWEIPGGYVDTEEDGPLAAAREVEEETGWRPRTVEYLMRFQPMVGSADAPQDLYVAKGAELVGEPEIDEAEAVRWVPLGEAREMIANGEIMGAATIIGVLHVLAEQATARPRIR